MPWTNFYSECALVQLGLFISFFFFNQAKTLFYAIVYMFSIFLWIGVFLCYYNVELFTGFLWVIELTVFFIIILFLFFFNFSGDLKHSKNFFWKFIFLFLIFFNFFFDDFSLKAELLNFNFFFDDFYEALNNHVLNDIHALFLSYYLFNSTLLFIFGFLIFLTTIVCISLLRAARNTVLATIGSLLSVYSFFLDLLNFEFLRKQNLFFQNLRKPVNRLVKKNLKEWFKKSQD